MRMRSKPNLIPRMEKCAHVIIDDPAQFQGNWLKQFAPEGRLFLEIGCGKGRFTAETASRMPNDFLVAIEKVPEALVMAVERVCEKALGNVRFIDGDALALPVLFAPEEVERIYLNFCDPWKKNRDAKHRLTAPGFLQIYESILATDGEIHFKTDNNPLFDFSVESFEAEGWSISELTRDLHAEGPVGVMTDYELKFYNRGVKINRLVARKENRL